MAIIVERVRLIVIFLYVLSDADRALELNISLNLMISVNIV